MLRDTTLREGIQVPGSRISQEQKQRFVSVLEEIGVGEIEIGLPDGMSACVELSDYIRKQGYRIQATALVPCYGARWPSQVDLAALHGVRRIDILAPISDYLLKDRDHYGLGTGDILPRLQQVISRARSTPLELGVGLIDACRAPLERILAIGQPLGEMGVSRLVIYDSVGAMLPARMTPLVAEVLRRTGLPILVHCHNDYGLATANSLAAVEGGATAVDVAVNGVGGRAGNAALEEVALALANLYGLGTGIDTTGLRQLSAVVEEMTGLKNTPLKPIVGDYCFAHVPVMHIRCVAGGNPSAFEPFGPAQVGAERTFDFSLPLDYEAALRPFAQKCGCAFDQAEVPALVAAIRRGSSARGCTEQQILQVLRDFKAEASNR